MEIVTSLKISELEQIIAASIQKCLNNKAQAQQSEPDDRVGIKEACFITGYSKATIYKMSYAGDIPCKKFGKKLVFSRLELKMWMQGKTISKQCLSEIAEEHLRNEANKKSI